MILDILIIILMWNLISRNVKYIVTYEYNLSIRTKKKKWRLNYIFTVQYNTV